MVNTRPGKAWKLGPLPPYLALGISLPSSICYNKRMRTSECPPEFCELFQQIIQAAQEEVCRKPLQPSQTEVWGRGQSSVVGLSPCPVGSGGLMPTLAVSVRSERNWLVSEAGNISLGVSIIYQSTVNFRIFSICHGNIIPYFLSYFLCSFNRIKWTRKVSLKNFRNCQQVYGHTAAS